MALDYLVLIIWAHLGVLQIAASYSGLYGLRLYSHRWKGYLAGSIIAASAFAWFFATGDRFVEGHLTGVQGAEQFELILAGVAVSTIVTAIVVSMLHLKSKTSLANSDRSLEGLRNATYFQTVIHQVKRRG